MKIIPKKYYEHLREHSCEDEKGNALLVDLFVSSSLENETNESIIGKTVECRLIPHSFIAMEAKVVETKLADERREGDL